MADGDLRFGLGFDVHARDVARQLWLGGVVLEGEAGLAGHSDADVVCHAVADGLLGAAALGDLGEHFADTDPAFAGIAGLDLLGRAVRLVLESGWSPVSCDATVILERPAIAPLRDRMRTNLAEVLGADLERVSVKASRPEGLGLSGDGAACLALVVLGPS